MMKLIAAAVVIAALTTHTALVTPPPANAAAPVNPYLLVAIEAAFPEEQHATALYVAWAESRGDCTARIIDTNNLVSAGCWQVQPYWWGEVSEDVFEQARQVAAIVAEHGWGPWTTAP